MDANESRARAEAERDGYDPVLTLLEAIEAGWQKAIAWEEHNDIEEPEWAEEKK